MGLPARIAVPILTAFAVVFLAIMGVLLKTGFGTTGAAFGPTVAAEQGDARAQATPAPLATDPPGTFTVPQTGSGPATNAQALPGNSTGGGPPAPVAAAIGQYRARLAKNPNDLAALVGLGNMEYDAARYPDAQRLYARALALDPGNPDVRTDYATALHQTGRDIDAIAELDRVLKARPDFPGALYNRGVVYAAIGRRTDAIDAFKRYLKHAPDGDPHAEDARTAIASLGGKAP